MLGTDGFLARFSSDGSQLEYATYLGGSGEDAITSLALGADGSVYLAGTTTSPDFPTTDSAFQRLHAGGLLGADAFVARFQPSGPALVLTTATLLGGSFDDTATSLAVDPEGRVWVAGATNSLDFPTVRPLQTAYAGPLREFEGDVFVARLSTDGTRLDFSTYFGGTLHDQSTGLALGPDGHVYVTGFTDSPDFPTTPGALYTARQGRTDAFALRLSIEEPTNWSLRYSTYLGGSQHDLATGNPIVEDNGALWLTGLTQDGAFLPTSTSNSQEDAFVLQLNPEATQISRTSTMGGTAGDIAAGLAMSGGDLCIVGTTTSADFPVQNAVQGNAPSDSSQAFVACYASPDRPVGLTEPPPLPRAHALLPNYPNPFYPETAIRFEVATQGRVEITLFDALGRRLDTIADAHYAPGRYAAQLDARGWASGVYFCHLRIDDFETTRQVVVLR